ncbi:hypothetical protein FF041_23600 [Streptomyces jumonjinensis]|uniref:Uncharacterized protein n=1 Tax=Streptomyces jumonjinensis TaxID=1945 RepID=A0A646KLU5_STRJU|nr:hypothetical protein [Streptomyces jumonjinensis]
MPFAAVGEVRGERVHAVEGDNHRHGRREVVRQHEAALVPIPQATGIGAEVGDGPRVLRQGLVNELTDLLVHPAGRRSAARVGEAPALGLDDEERPRHRDKSVDVRVPRCRVGGASMDPGVPEHRGQGAAGVFFADVLTSFVEALEQVRVIATGFRGPVECLVQKVAGARPQTAFGVQADDRSASQRVGVTEFA